MRLQLSAFFDPVRRLRFMPWRRGLQLAWKAVVYAGLSLLCLLVLAWLTLQWGILPHIQDWRADMERHASRAVGVPVRIGSISVRSSGWIPTLDLRDVVLRDASGAEALRLPRVSASLSPRSLLVMSPRLAQLYIEDARLLVRRDKAGHVHVGGLDLAARATVSSADEAATLDWFFSQEELVLRNGAVRWIDEQRDAPALELTDVDIVLRNGLRSHDMRVDATPPAAWGDRFSLRARTRQPLFSYAGDWRRWTGTVYADLPRGDVAQLKHHVDLPFELQGGTGSLRLWLDFQNNHWRSATADVQLDGVGVRLASNVQPLAIVHAGGRLSASRDPAGVTLSAEHFGFQTVDGVAWPAGDVRVSWQEQQRSVFVRQGRRAYVSYTREKALAEASGHALAASAPASTSSGKVPWDDLEPVTGGEFAADHLDLALMRRLAAALPLPPVAQKWLADYQPEGMVRQLDAHWTGPLAAPSVYRVDASVTGFSMAAGAVPEGARNGRPGWRNANVTVAATEAGGTARLSLDGGSIELPGVFEEPVIPFDRFSGNASWKIAPSRDPAQDPAISVGFDDVRFANADAEGRLQLQWHSGVGVGVATATATATATSASASASAPGSAAFGRGQRFPGAIDLKGVVTHARAERLARYLPQQGLDSTRSYLAAAFSDGEMDNVRINVRGDLAAFPYQRQHDGDFHIDGHVRGVTLDYVPGARADDGTRAPSQWPPFTQVAGQIVLDRGALEIRDAAGRMGELVLHDVNGGFKSLYEQPTLVLHGQVSGPMTDFLRYVAQSPVSGWLHGGLANATATGNADLDLALDIPLQQADHSTVNGALTLPGNDVRLVTGAPTLADAHARVAFTEKGVTVSGGHARALGGDTTFDGGTLPDGSLRFTALGTVSADGLRQVAAEAVLARLASHVSGQANYKLTIGIAKGQTEFALTSPLTGLGLTLPAPLDKPADATWPLSVSTTLSFEDGRPRDTLHVALSQPRGSVMQAEVLRDRSGDAPRPLRAAYAVGAPLPPMQPGGILLLHGPAFNGDAWLAFWRGLGTGTGTGTGTGASGAASAPSANTLAAANDEMGISYVPGATELKTPDLVIGGRHLTNVDVMLAQVIASGDDVWRSNIVSDQTKGVVEYRPETSSRGAQLFARLDRLALDARDMDGDGTSNAANAPAPETAQATTVPALDIVVDNFELNGKKLGKLEVAATLQSGGRDWRLTRLALTTPEARLTGSGRWTGATSRHVSLDFDLQLADSGAFLGRLGMGQLLRKGKGKLAGSVTWTGSPLALDVASLQGKLRVEIDEGQFLKVDAGAGRLLGILSLQSLPRRFMLDFRDLFSEGFAFDNVTGDVLIERGVANTKDFRMRSATAAVLMSGRTDLKAETQDLDVIIVPEVNAGAASLAYAAINPVIGIGTFLAQLFLRSPLTEAGTREVHVTGTWSQPRMDEVEHRAAVAAAAAAASAARAAEAAAAAASAP
jgi:uncharacterized protein (TIGR02099 family)